MADEIAVYCDENIQITNLRAMMHGKTYAMANVTSVSTYTQEVSKVPGVIILVLGALFLLAAVGGDWVFGVIGVILLLLGAGAYSASKHTYWVRIGSASGETNALSSRDRAYIERVVSAMNEAIVRRG